MTTVSVTLSDEHLLQLQVLAREAKQTPEDLLSMVVTDWLSRPKGDFARAAEYVLRKNAELYRRLA
jgi:antitoxin FitA